MIRTLILFFFLSGYALEESVYTVEETLTQIEERISQRKTGAYFCFDTEDVEVALGKRGEIGEEIEMQELLACKDPAILKSRLLPYTAFGNHKWALKLFNRFSSSWDSSYAPIGPAFLRNVDAKRWIQFLRFLRTQNLLFIGEIPPDTKELLFGANCRLFKEGEMLEPYTVILLGMGWKGKLWAKQVLEEFDSVFVIDLNLLREPLAQWRKEDWEHWLIKNGNVKILYTSALLPERFEGRKQEYMHSLQVIKDYGFINNTYIVEALGYTPLSFYEEYGRPVLYVNKNDRSLVNKGVSEAKLLKAAFAYFDFDDEDMIIKLTGRYFFNDDRFLKLVLSEPDTDAFVSYWGDKGIVTTGCYAMRGKYYKKMLEEMDLYRMESELIAIETVVTEFLKKAGCNVRFLDKMGITANVADLGILEQQ